MHLININYEKHDSSKASRLSCYDGSATWAKLKTMLLPKGQYLGIQKRYDSRCKAHHYSSQNRVICRLCRVCMLSFENWTNRGCKTDTTNTASTRHIWCLQGQFILDIGGKPFKKSICVPNGIKFLQRLHVLQNVSWIQRKAADENIQWRLISYTKKKLKIGKIE